MAKKYEFKPDRTGTSDLGKLYITKKQRKIVLRWSLFALCCLVLLTAFGIFLSVFRQMYLRKGWGSTLFCTGLALLGYEMAVFIIGLLLGLTRPDRLGSFLMTVLLTGLTMPLMYPVLSAVSKIGGETWKE